MIINYKNGVLNYKNGSNTDNDFINIENQSVGNVFSFKLNDAEREGLDSLLVYTNWELLASANQKPVDENATSIFKIRFELDEQKGECFCYSYPSFDNECKSCITKIEDALVDLICTYQKSCKHTFVESPNVVMDAVEMVCTKCGHLEYESAWVIKN